MDNLFKKIKPFDRRPFAIEYGTTRIAMLVGGLVFKFPRLSFARNPDNNEANTVRQFLLGLYSNHQEYRFWNIEHHHALMPVYWCLPFGFMLIGKRYRYMFNDELLIKDIRGVCERLDNPDLSHTNYALETMSSAPVCIDYGHPYTSYKKRGTIENIDLICE